MPGQRSKQHPVFPASMSILCIAEGSLESWRGIGASALSKVEVALHHYKVWVLTLKCLNCEEHHLYLWNMLFSFSFWNGNCFAFVNCIFISAMHHRAACRVDDPQHEDNKEMGQTNLWKITEFIVPFYLENVVSENRAKTSLSIKQKTVPFQLIVKPTPPKKKKRVQINIIK